MLYKFYWLLIVMMAGGCTKFVTVDEPRTEPSGVTVFADEKTAMQTVTGMYSQLLKGFASGDVTSITYFTMLSSDEGIAGPNGSSDFNNNKLLSTDQGVAGLWDGMYAEIYIANSIVEKVAPSALTLPVKQQLSGEAKFIRAFCYFYLTNLFGRVPLTLTTNYIDNSKLPRSSINEVYDQIIKDLNDAQNVLSAGDNKGRASYWTATALLARVYLYRGMWADAEIESGKIINNDALFKLSAVNSVFKKNSDEAIWQLHREGNNPEALTFADVSFISLRPSVVASFSPNDLRRKTWIINMGAGLYRPAKYRLDLPEGNYSTVLRLAEQYLIRAEARTQQGNISGAAGAVADINVLRFRAGMPNIKAMTQEEMMLIIERERAIELFSEWGHRWLDLKRWPSIIKLGDTRADDILQPLKLDQWQSSDKLYPIPQSQIDNSGATDDSSQNPGYRKRS